MNNANLDIKALLERLEAAGKRLEEWYNPPSAT